MLVFVKYNNKFITPLDRRFKLDLIGDDVGIMGLLWKGD